MINKGGQIEVSVGHTFSDGDKIYRAVMSYDCGLCVFNHIPFDQAPCSYIACTDKERKDGKGVHFIKEGGEE